MSVKSLQTNHKLLSAPMWLILLIQGRVQLEMIENPIL